ncbi:MAG: exodeoxyribonuclease VII large subunit [Bacteroidia bacterium]|nr:exodeoxyribonuclease VII large subunit [Bacteroidia bacterium]
MPAEKTEYSVGELTHYIKFRLEQDENLQSVSVTGEISNLTRHSSGHLYFTLKDEMASLTSVMFKGNVMQHASLPGNGEKVVVTGDISVYPPRGNYQFIVRTMRRAGLGDLHQQFLELKARLEAEGLFDPARKKALPRFPRKIGLVTSPTGAVIQDIINTLRRRYPHLELVVSPAKVQGSDAVPSLVMAMGRLLKEPGVELVILARGGGSLEDLWPFNEEGLARAIYGYPLPVISAIGHETDFTIADFVADKRASTPTAAAEMAVPEEREIREQLNGAAQALQNSLQYFIHYRRQMVDDYQRRLSQALENKLSQARQELSLLEVKLQAADMRKPLAQGFTYTLLNGQPVTDPAQLKEGDQIETIFQRGKARSTVESTQSFEN